MASKNPLLELAALGQSIWLDSIQRSQIASGELAKLVREDGLRGETANPTIFEKAIVASAEYDDSIRSLARAGKRPPEIYEALMIEDIRAAADVFRPVYDDSQGADGFVSIEVSPKLAHDTAGTIAEVRRFWEEIERPNVMVKIPGTPEGVPAIEETLAEGININITLLFSVASYEEVIGAYLRALERRVSDGKRVDRLASVASFFVSRIDTLADRRIEDALRNAPNEERKNALRGLLGKIAIANAKRAYQSFKRIFGSEEFAKLQALGARVQRPLWASTSTKNRRYSDVMYVEPLIGRDTVNTLPLETIRAFRDHGRARLTIEEDIEGAERTLAELENAGFSLDDITRQVLDEGVDKFSASYDDLLRGIESKLAHFGMAPEQERGAA